MKLLRTEGILFVALLVTLVFVPIVGATGNELHAAPTNPEFIRYMNEKLYDSQVQNGTHRLGVIPSPIYHPEIRDIQMFGPNAGDRSTSYQSLFDLRASGKVSPVKNQNPNGTCWAFATYSSLESTLMPATPTPNFSEKNLVNLAGFILPGSPEDAGGTAKMSTAYLARWNGPVNSSTDPYPTVAGTWTNSSTYPPVKHVQNVVFFPGRTSRTDTDNIKGGLTRWGALYTVFNVFDDNESDILWYNASYTSFYQPVSDPYYNNSHAVAFVGWNDAYEATNFTITPPGPGAWIVKNSWGTGWGDGGFFYVSYYDKFIGSAIDNQSSWDTVAFLGENTSNYDTVYSYDKLGEVQDYTYGTNKTGSFANVFTANSSETIKAVGFYTTDLNVPTTISIYKNPTSGPVGGTPAAQFSQTLPYMGYNSVVIPSGQEVSVTAGDKFSVVVQVTNPINDEYIPIEENKIDYTSGITSQMGQGYVLKSGEWYDLKTIDGWNNSHVCVKAYTSSTGSLPVANFSGTPLSGTAPLTVAFTDTSTGSPTSWNWSFGDESYSTEKNPSHIYSVNGTYTVSLNATNSAGSNTCTRSNYITVSSGSAGYTVGAKNINSPMATVCIGEQGLDFTGALQTVNGGGNITRTAIGWWASAAQITTSPPTISIDLAGQYTDYQINPATFVGYTGNWWLLQGPTDPNPGQSFDPPRIFMYVLDPSLAIKIWDYNNSTEVTGGSVPQGEHLGFQIYTNMYWALDARYRAPVYNRTGVNTDNVGDGYMMIRVQDPSGTTLTNLYSSDSLLKTLTYLNVSTQPYTWGTEFGNNYNWDTGSKVSAGTQYVYTPGTYTVYAESYLNNMKNNYKNGGSYYTGKTISETKTVTVTAVSGMDTVGVFRNGSFYLKDATAFGYGLTGDFPIAGDWLGSGVDTGGVFRNGSFYLKDGSSFSYGLTGDKPVTGNWTGDRTTEVGVFRDGLFFLRNSTGGTEWFEYGRAGDYPIAGDWDGDGLSEVGVFRDGVFYLRASNGTTYDAFGWGLTGDSPIAGDWNGDRKTEVGVFRDGSFYLRAPDGSTYSAFGYGLTGDTPIAGKWI